MRDDHNDADHPLNEQQPPRGQSYPGQQPSPQGEPYPQAGSQLATRGNAGLPTQYGPPGYNAEPYYADDEINLWDYIHVLLRRRWSVVAVFTACVLGALIFSLAATPMYKSTVLLEIQPGGPNVMGDVQSVTDPIAQAQAYNDFFQTQYDILASRELARRSIDELDLRDDPWLNGELAAAAFVGRSKATVKGWLGSSESDGLELAERKFEHDMFERFTEQVEVKPRRKSFLVELSFSSPDAELSQRVSTELADQYRIFTIDQSQEAARSAREFIEKQREYQQAELSSAEAELQVYARANDILAMEQEAGRVHERLTDLITRHTASQARRIEAESLHSQGLGRDRRSLPLLVNNALLKSLREELSEARAIRAELGSRFTDEFPD
ncbi:MAG: Wzz/FepE/Etk N-terminal domain-containing protein, partial [bacterium]